MSVVSRQAVVSSRRANDALIYRAWSMDELNGSSGSEPLKDGRRRGAIFLAGAFRTYGGPYDEDRAFPAAAPLIRSYLAPVFPKALLTAANQLTSPPITAGRETDTFP